MHILRDILVGYIIQDRILILAYMYRRIVPGENGEWLHLQWHMRHPEDDAGAGGAASTDRAGSLAWWPYRLTTGKGDEPAT